MIGILILLVTVGVWRKMEGKTPIKLNGKTIGAIVMGVFGALLPGVGIVSLLMLIPFLKGLK